MDWILPTLFFLLAMAAGFFLRAALRAFGKKRTSPLERPDGAAEQYVIRGRAFSPLGWFTPARFDWMLEQLEEAGLTKLAMPEGNDADAFAHETLMKLIRGGRRTLILGGMVAPAGTRDGDWTPKMARETADWFDRSADPADVEVINGLTLSMLASFFASGLISAKRSPTSSETKVAGQPQALPGNEAQTTTGAGAMSSAS